MKLNNQGFSLTQMLLCCGILLFFLLVTIFMIRQLTDSFGDAFKNSLVDPATASDIENRIEEASLKYISEFYKQDIGTGTITITVENLKKNKYLDNSDLYLNKKGNICDGYALVFKDNTGKIETDAYIKCGEYVTDGFQSWRLGA